MSPKKIFLSEMRSAWCYFNVIFVCLIIIVLCEQNNNYSNKHKILLLLIMLNVTFRIPNWRRFTIGFHLAQCREKVSVSNFYKTLIIKFFLLKMPSSCCVNYCVKKFQNRGHHLDWRKRFTFFISASLSRTLTLNTWHLSIVRLFFQKILFCLFYQVWKLE